MKKLLSKYHIDKNTGCLCRHIKAPTEKFILHTHDYFEIFFFKNGSAVHSINGQCQPLLKGNLVFIRPEDEHNYLSPSKDLEFYNIAFDKETFEMILNFLGDGYNSGVILDPELSPCVSLSCDEATVINNKFSEILSIDYKNKSAIKMKTRLLITSLLTKYFSDYESTVNSIPEWLSGAVEKMHRPENFRAGKDAFFRLCSKSPEHCSRTLKKYYGQTPSSLVNDIRLTYSKKLLETTDLNILNICFESGFINVSWFYDKFKEKYGLTPLKFRNIRKDS